MEKEFDRSSVISNYINFLEKYESSLSSLNIITFMLNRYKRSVLFSCFIISVAVIYYAFTLFEVLNSGGTSAPPSSESTRAQWLFVHKYKSPNPDLLIILNHPVWTVSNANFTHAYFSFKKSLLSHYPKIYGIISHFDYPHASGLVSTDRHKTLVQLRYDNIADLTLDNWKATAAGNPLDIHFSGNQVINDEIVKDLANDLERIESGSIPVLLVLLVFAYGGIVAVSAPLILAGWTVLWTFFLLHLVTLGFNVTNYATNVVTAFGIGISIDFSIFLHLRFSEEMEKVRNNPKYTLKDAVERTLMTSGRTVLFSAILLVTTLSGALQFNEFYLTTMALSMMFIAATAAIGAFIITPCMYLLLGEKLFYLSISPMLSSISKYFAVMFSKVVVYPDQDTVQHFDEKEMDKTKATSLVTESDLRDPWFITISFVLKYSWAFLIVITAGMVILTAFFCSQVKFADFSWANLPKSSELRYNFESLQQDFSSPGEGNMNIFLQCKEIDEEFIRALDIFCTKLENYEYVTGVSSMVRLDNTLNVTDYVRIYTNPFSAANYNRSKVCGDPFYYSNLVDIARVTVGINLKDSDPRIGRATRGVRDMVGNSFTYSDGSSMLVDHAVGGDTASAYDLIDDLRGTLPKFIAVIVCLMTFFVVLLTGSLVLPLKVVVTSFLSISSSFAFMMFVFQNGDGADVLNFNNNFSCLDELQLLFIFVVAFGLSLDYEVFILGRIQELYEKTGDHQYAVAKGVSSSAKSVSMAAILLCTAIGGFLVSDLIVLKMIGMGIGLTVVLDATIIRCIFLPALLGVLGKYTWWAPKFVKDAVSYVGLQERED